MFTSIQTYIHTYINTHTHTHTHIYIYIIQKKVNIPYFVKYSLTSKLNITPFVISKLRPSHGLAV